MRCANVCDVPVFDPYTTFSLYFASFPFPSAPAPEDSELDESDDARRDCWKSGTSVDVGATATGRAARRRGTACT